MCPQDEAAAESWRARMAQASLDVASWGCPAAGALPVTHLDPDLAAEASHAASTLGCDPFTTCPFAEVLAASPWVVEITDAVARAADAHVPIADSLGVDALSCVDLAAITEIQRAQSAAYRSDRAIAEQQRKATEKIP